MPRATLTAAARAAGVSKQSASKARHCGRLTSDADELVDRTEAQATLGKRRTGRPATPVPTSAAGETLAMALLRKESALASLRELEVAKMRGELIPAGEVVEGWQSAIGRARALLLRIPHAVAPEVVRAPDRKAVVGILTQAIHGALHELADTRADTFDEETDT